MQGTLVLMTLLTVMPAPVRAQQEATGVVKLEATYLFPGIHEGHRGTYRASDFSTEALGTSRSGFDALAARVVRLGIVGGESTYRFTVTFTAPATPADLDLLARGVYLSWRAERLPELRGSVVAVQLRLDQETRALEEAAQKVRDLTVSKHWVLDRRVALAASAERVETLRSQLVDARLERAVLEAQSHFLSDRSRRDGEEKTAKLEAEIEALAARGYTEKHPQLAAVRRRLESARALADGTDERLIELEMKRIGIEERMKLLEQLMVEEQEWGKGLLEAVDLGAAAVRLDDVTAGLRETEKRLRELHAEVEILEKGEPRRLEAEGPRGG